MPAQGQYTVPADVAEQVWRLARTYTERTLAGKDPIDVKLSRDARREMVRMDDELTKDWKAGKPIERRMHLQYVPMVMREMYGLKLEAGPVPGWPLGYLDPAHPLRTAVMKAIAMNTMAEMMMHAGAGFSVREESVLSEQFRQVCTGVYVYHKSLLYGLPNVFTIRDEVIEKLMNTDAEDIRTSDIGLPFPAFHLQFPGGKPGETSIFRLRNVISGLHNVSFASVAEGYVPEGQPLPGRHLFCVLHGEPRPDSRATADDHLQVSWIPIDDGRHMTLAELFDASDEQNREMLTKSGEEWPALKKDASRWYGESFGVSDTVNLIRRLVINFCLYLSSPNPDVQPVTGKRSWTATVDAQEKAQEAEPRRTTVRVHPGGRAELWDVGRSIGKLVQISKTDILVRGHWRRQPYGPRRTLRRVIWIEPHIRRPTEGEDGAPPGHEYVVNA